MRAFLELISSEQLDRINLCRIDCVEEVNRSISPSVSADIHLLTLFHIDLCTELGKGHSGA